MGKQAKADKGKAKADKAKAESATPPVDTPPVDTPPVDSDSVTLPPAGEGAIPSAAPFLVAGYYKVATAILSALVALVKGSDGTVSQVPILTYLGVPVPVHTPISGTAHPRSGHWYGLHGSRTQLGRQGWDNPRTLQAFSDGLHYLGLSKAKRGIGLPALLPRAKETGAIRKELGWTLALAAKAAGKDISPGQPVSKATLRSLMATVFPRT
jgi:hypothetical protein